VRKKIAIIIVIFMWTAVFIAAYHYFNNKFVQEAIAYDNQRLYDISINDYHISKYYIDHNALPGNLTELASSETNDAQHIAPPILQDPQTDKAYAYTPEGNNIYKICTTFSTDTIHDHKLADAYTTYITSQLGRYAKSVYHNKGYDCIELSMTGNQNAQNNSAIDTTKLQPFTFSTPSGSDKICLDQDITLSWTADQHVDSVGIYLISPVSMKQPESWLQNGYAVSPGVIVGTSVQGHVVWHVGMLDSNKDKTAQEVVKPSAGYRLGVLTRYDNGIEIDYSSNVFEIADCTNHGEKK
jgi:hypothetical protein